MKRSILAVVIAVCLLVSLFPSARGVSSGDLIWELLTFYSHHQENARTDILRILDQLRTVEPEAADNWQQIMDAWSQVSAKKETVPTQLPEDLPQDDSLCIVVMGFALDYYGGMQSELLGRMETFLSCAEQYPNAYLLCTGGGTAYGNPYVTEAGQMADWLREQGVDPVRIIVENRSYSTELNAKYSLEILSRDYPQVNTLALVSSDYHLRRCRLLFQSMLALTDREAQYTVAGWAGYEAGYIGESGYFAEAESLGNLVGLTVRNTTPPALSALTGIEVSGVTEYLPGENLSLVITASYDTGFTRDVTALAKFPETAPEGPGNHDLTVSYTENGITKEAVISLTVLPPPTVITEAPETAPTEEPTIPPTEPPAEESASGSDWILPTAASGVIALLIVITLLLRKRTKGKFEK